MDHRTAPSPLPARLGTQLGSPPGSPLETRIEVVSWTDLAALPDVLDELTEQAATILRHAETWVCRTRGFEPSPVCVLRPVVPVLHQLEEAFGALGDALVRELAVLRQGVVTSHAVLTAADDAARAALPAAPTPTAA